MKTINQAFSRANTSFADEGLSTTQLAMYIDAAQDSLEDIARDCFLWEKNRWFYVATTHPDKPPVMVSESIAQVNYPLDDIQTVPDNVVRSFSPAPASAKSVQILPVYNETRSVIIPASETPRYTLRVARNGQDCKEFPYPTILSNLDFNRPFWNNDSQLSGVAFATRLLDDESLEVIFAEPLLAGDYIYICYTAQRPIDFTTVIGSDAVPDWVFAALVAGIKLNLAKMFFSRGNDRMAARVQMFEKDYTQMKYKAAEYSRNLRDRRSTIVLQPLKFLSDTTTRYY